MTRIIFLALGIAVSPVITAGEISSFLGIPLGTSLPGEPLSPPARLGPIPIYSVRVPVAAPYDKYFHDAQINVTIENGLVGAVMSERAFPSQKACIEAKDNLIQLLASVYKIEPDMTGSQGYTFVSPGRHADVSCVISSGARHYKLSATAGDDEVEAQVIKSMEEHER
jgi:hypothetical protein